MQGRSALIQAGFKGLGLNVCFLSLKGPRQALQERGSKNVHHSPRRFLRSSIKHLPGAGRGRGGSPGGERGCKCRDTQLWWLSVGGVREEKGSQRKIIKVGKALPCQVGACCVLPKKWLWRTLSLMPSHTVLSSPKPWLLLGW